MGGERKPPRAIRAQQLAGMMRQDHGAVLLLDCRSITEYNLLHVVGSVSFGGSKRQCRRLLEELLPQPSQQENVPGQKQVVVYDQGRGEGSAGPALSVVVEELRHCPSQVSLLEGGFAEFSSWYPSLCEGHSASLLHASISQPCLSTSAISVTHVLPHLYLGSQSDVLSQDVVSLKGITHVLNVSCSCPQPSFIPSSRFLRIPINDSYSDNILPWLDRAADFIDKAEVMNGRVLLHCFAGVSRSAAFAIAYVMYSAGLPLDEAYRFVKEKRPSISPNFNFLGQLLEYEAVLSCAASLQATPRPSLADSLTPAFSDWGHRCFQRGTGCPSCSSVELAEEARELEPVSLLDQFNSLEISSEIRREAQAKKCSFSLEVKSLYTPPTPSTLEAPTAFSTPSGLSSDPRSWDVWNRIFGGGFGLFSLFSDNKGTQSGLDNKGTQSGLVQQVDKSRACKKSMNRGYTTGQQEPKKAPQPFVLSRPSCKQRDPQRESSLEEGLRGRTVALVPV